MYIKIYTFFIIVLICHHWKKIDCLLLLLKEIIKCRLCLWVSYTLPKNKMELSPCIKI